jgi:hypothetical protein
MNVEGDWCGLCGEEAGKYCYCDFCINFIVNAVEAYRLTMLKDVRLDIYGRPLEIVTKNPENLSVDRKIF